jgi:virulence factor
MFDHKKLKVAVIGAGRMGTFHAGVYHKMRDVELVAIVDTDYSKAQKLARHFQCQAYSDVRKLFNTVDAVSITSCTNSHYKIGISLLTAGIHALIEKPLAVCMEHAQHLLQVSSQSGTFLSVGHIEQFNPAFQALSGNFINDQEIETIDVKRFGLFSNRISDTSVIMDLMIHDLELIFSLVQSPLKSLTAHGLIKGDHTKDYVSANLHFQNGILATLIASRITSANIRSFNVSSSKGYFIVDSLQQSLKISTKPILGRGQAIEEVTIHKKDALTLQLSHFVDCVLERSSPKIKLENVLKALEAALNIESQVALRDQSPSTFREEEVPQTVE